MTYLKDGDHITTCRNCGIEITFRKDTSGKAIPLELSEQEIAVIPFQPPTLAVFTKDHEVIRGKQVGDSYEQSQYYYGRKIHICNKS
jgi:hypothetical protein